ncbi:CAP domain-containing protein [Patescibacteria group bacterium]
MQAYSPNREVEAIKKYRFIYHFLPHPEQRKRARLLSLNALLGYVLLLVVLLGFFRLVPRYLPGILGYASNISTSDLLRYTNKEREEAGLGTLEFNPTLSKAAAQKAKHMFENNYWAHVSPDGTEPWDFILSSGYDYIYAGENLAKNFSNSKSVVEAWVQSPTHRENLMNPNYEEIGFAVVNGVLDGYETTLVVQMFGKGRSPAYLAEVPVVEEAFPEVNSVQIETVGEPVVTSPVLDVRQVSRSTTFLFGGFLVTLFSLDLWYSKKHKILKVSGHTLAHLLFLIVVLGSVLISVLPGAIL